MSKTKTNTQIKKLKTRRTTREMRFFVLKCPISSVTECPNEEWQGERK
jgi:hypothetical protein